MAKMSSSIPSSSLTGRPELPRCTFCNKNQRQIRFLIVNGPDAKAFICNECIEFCVDIMQRKQIPTLIDLRRQVDSEREFRPLFAKSAAHKRSNYCFYLGPFTEPFNTIYAEHVR